MVVPTKFIKGLSYDPKQVPWGQLSREKGTK